MRAIKIGPVEPCYGTRWCARAWLEDASVISMADWVAARQLAADGQWYLTDGCGNAKVIAGPYGSMETVAMLYIAGAIGQETGGMRWLR